MQRAVRYIIGLSFFLFYGYDAFFFMMLDRVRENVWEALYVAV